MATVQIFPDAQFLARAAAEHVIQVANEAVRERGLFSIVLSGGSTPQMLYHLLSTEPYSESIDWSKMHVFWGDERSVPPDSPESNYGRAKAVMLDALPVLPENIHRVHTEFKPEQAAAAYEETLLEFFSSLPSLRERGQAGFDLVLLGMGEDGHTASLFPGTPAVEEKTRWVMAQYVDKLAAWRITLTPALLNRAKKILFLVSGAGKSQVLQKVVYGSYQPERYPAQVIQPEEGDLVWLVDEDAAAQF
jgi:6-phosphogluconolactonase